MCHDQMMDNMMVWIGLVLVIGIMLVMTIVICHMKRRKANLRASASTHYQERARQSGVAIFSPNNQGDRSSAYEALRGTGSTGNT